MRVLRSKKFIALVAGIVVAGVSAAVAVSGATTHVIIDTSAVHLRIQTATLDSYDSGWHIHPGLVFVKVHEGSLQVYEDGCTPKTVGAGETTIETPYMPIRVLATHAVETVTFILNGPDQVAVPLSAYRPDYNPCPSLK